MKNAPIRVRFAPSPTGFLHVGGARTALFNWLFARHNGGAFVLRVEDTDSARFRPEYVRGIYDALRWLRIDWDEGPDVGGEHYPYVQSERAALHRQAAQRLAEDGHAYECYCAKPSAESADPDDDDLESAASPACNCATMSEAEIKRRSALGVSAALRFRVDPTRTVTVNDVIRGDVTFPAGTIDDFVIVKSDGNPLYNFAATVDDHTMEISHVIRGEEHLANAPKQLLIYEAFGWQPPVMAHLPIILNEQRRKLSKRDGATFVNDYRDLGFLPEALVNFLALLGWSPGDNRELMTLDEMIRDFRLEGVVKHPAIFDVAKLAWMNKEYLKKLTPAEAAGSVVAILAKRIPQATRTRPEYIERVTALLLERVHTLADIIDQGAYFFTDGPIEPAPEALQKYCTDAKTVSHLSVVRSALADASGFSTAEVEAAIRGLAERNGVKAAAYIHPLRVALTGQAVSPGIFEVASILGRDASLRRIKDLLSKIAGSSELSTRATKH